MTALWVILAVLLGIILLITLLIFAGRAKIRIIYREKLRIRVSVCGIPFSILNEEKETREKKNLSTCKNPERVLKKELKKRRKAAKKALKKALEKKRKALEKARLKHQRKTTEPSLDIKSKIGIVWELLKSLKNGTTGKLRICVRAMKIRIATGDAAKTAVLYGAVVQNASLLLEWIDQNFTEIRRKDGNMEIIPDYLGSSSQAEIDIECGMRFSQLIALALDLFTTYKESTAKALKKARKKQAAQKNKIQNETLDK